MPYKDPEKNRERNKKYYWQNREKALLRMKKYREENREKRKVYQRNYEIKNKARRNAQAMESYYRLRDNHLNKLMYRRAKARAKRRDLEFSIEPDDITIPLRCPVLNIPLGIGNENYYNSPSLDRIDSSKGYIKGNVRVISWRANSLKKDANIDEFRHLYVDAILNLNKIDTYTIIKSREKVNSH